MAAVLVSTTALATLAIAGERPTLPELISWLDMETLLLLFSMMLLVAIMAETGMFDYLAVFTFEVNHLSNIPYTYPIVHLPPQYSIYLSNSSFTNSIIKPVTLLLYKYL